MTTLALSGCVSTKEQIAATAGPPPANYKALAAQYVRDTWFDPYSLRDVQISAPQPGGIGFRNGWRSCIKANGKNRLGAYTGLQHTMVLFGDGKVVDSFTGATACLEANYAPWPEMDAGAKRS